MSKCVRLFSLQNILFDCGLFVINIEIISLVTNFISLFVLQCLNNIVLNVLKIKAQQLCTTLFIRNFHTYTHTQTPITQNADTVTIYVFTSGNLHLTS